MKKHESTNNAIIYFNSKVQNGLFIFASVITENSRIMGLIGGILGGAASAVGGIFASKAANKGYKEAIQMYENRMNDVKAHRDAVYYQDPTQSAESQAAVTEAKQLLDTQTKQAQASNIVAGGTDESIALQKAAVAQTVGSMMNQQAAAGEAKKERAWSDADSQINSMTQYIAQAKQAQSQAKAKAISDAAGGLANGLNGLPI